MKIDLAYCCELKRELNITDACLEFANQDTYEKFTFLCSDPACWEKKIRITGVNHNRPQEESPGYRSPHYRKWDEHEDSCQWVELEQALVGSASSTERSSREDDPIDTHRITHFRLLVPDEVNTESEELRRELNRIRAIPGKGQRLQARRDYYQRLGATTSSLDNLVSYYEEMSQLNRLDEAIHISGKGDFTLRSLFSPLSRGIQDHFVIYYGGASVVKRYGAGFSLKFMDKLNVEGQDLAITLYLSHEQASSRYGRLLKERVDRCESMKAQRAYLKVYWIGGLEKNEKGNLSVVFAKLPDLTLRFTIPQRKAMS